MNHLEWRAYPQVSRVWRSFFSIILLLALLFILGWVFDLRGLYQISDAYAPVPFNSALALFCMASAFLMCQLAGHRWADRFRRLLSLFVAYVGLSSLTSHFLQTDLGIYILEQSLTPRGRQSQPLVVSLNSGIAFLTLGLVAYTFDRWRHRYVRIFQLVMATVASVVGIMSVFGYFSGVKAGYHWGEYSQMPPQLGVICLLTSLLSITRLVVNEWLFSGARSKYPIALTVSFLIFSATIGVWNALRLDDRRNFEKFMAISTKEFALNIRQVIDRSFRDFLSFSQFFDRSISTGEFKKDVSYVMSQNPYVRMAAVHNDRGEISWVFNDQTSEIFRDKVRTQYFQEFFSYSSNGIVSPIGQAYLRFNFDTSSLVYILENDQTSNEYEKILQLIDFGMLIAPIIRRYESKGHYFTVKYNDRILHEPVEHSWDPALGEPQIASVSVDNFELKIIGHPSPQLYQQLSTRIPHLIMFLGLFASVLAFFASGFLVEIHMRESLLVKSEQALKLSRDKAEDANRSKSEFLANMSHEIRTPLNAIVGFTELLVINSKDDRRRRTCVDGILRNSSLLTSLIEDILDLSKIEAGRLSVEKLKTSLADIAGDIQSMLAGKAQAKGVALELANRGAVPSIIITDPTRLRQILLNIVGNAVKYTHSGYVSVVFQADTYHHRLNIDVKDTGIGIPEEKQNYLFHPFTQADPSMTRKYGGTGLGLVLSRKLANNLGGDVVLIHSRESEGAVFRISIALELPDDFEWLTSLPEVSGRQPLTPLPSEIEAKKFVGAQILVVDDALDNRVITASYLKLLGAEVEVAGDGKEALAKVLHQSFDLVFMDLQMPVLNGYEATIEMRNRSLDLPIVALTANAMKEEREKCLRSGFNDYLSKPISLEKIQTMVSKHLHKNLGSPSHQGAKVISLGKLDKVQAKVLPIFFRTTDERLEAMRRAFSEENPDAVARTAHQIRGVARTLGLHTLGESAAKLEDGIKAGSELAGLRCHFDDFERHYVKAREEFHSKV